MRTALWSCCASKGSDGAVLRASDANSIHPDGVRMPACCYALLAVLHDAFPQTEFVLAAALLFRTASQIIKHPGHGVVLVQQNFRA